MGSILITSFLFLIVFLFALGVIFSKNAVNACIYLVMDLFFMAAIYATLSADFIAAIQVIIYTGAVLVLFLFVTMILGQETPVKDLTLFKAPLFFSGAAITSSLLILLFNPIPQYTQGTFSEQSNTQGVALELFTKNFWPFELTSFLILLAIVSCLLINHKSRVQKDGSP